MAQTPGDAVTSPENKPLDYGCTDWRMSSQKAADLYRSGAKLWRKEDLKDIEEQLEKAYTLERFSVRRIDGSIIQISNPMFQVQNPIWKPHVKYQEYWNLVREKPDGPIETYHCSYLVEWVNHIARDFRTFLSQPMQVFDEKQLLWQNSMTRKHLTALVRDLIGTNTVKKVVCFALGDFCRTGCSMTYPDGKEPFFDAALDMELLQSCMIQHSMALTIAQLCCGDEPVPVFTQDPGYTAAAEEIVTNKGFKIVGRHGAGGFAEIDEETIVISIGPKVPVIQIIADLARPALIISSHDGVFDDFDEPYADAESPRTRQMCLDHYDSYNLPIQAGDVEVSKALEKLRLYCRRQQPPDSQGA